MINRKPLNWFSMLFVWNGSVLPKVLPRLLLLFGLSCIVVYLKGSLFEIKIPLAPPPLTIFGIALALFLGFRNTVSYDRFWEGRKLWGAALNETRSLARKVCSLAPNKISKEFANEFTDLLICFVYTLKHQLRFTDATADLRKRLNNAQAEKVIAAKFKPVVLNSLLSESTAKMQQEGKIDSIIQMSFEDGYNKLSDIVGGCERIASTPIPYTYRVLLHRTVYIYCFLLPFGFVDGLAWMTPLIVTFIAYTFVALEAVADEIEDPFGTEPNDLALNTMANMIEETLLEISGRPIPVQEKKETYLLD